MLYCFYCCCEQISHILLVLSHILLVPLVLTLINLTHSSSVFIIDFQQISHIVVISLLLTLTNFTCWSSVFCCWLRTCCRHFYYFFFFFLFFFWHWETFSHLFLVFILLFSRMLPLMWCIWTNLHHSYFLCEGGYAKWDCEKL